MAKILWTEVDPDELSKGTPRPECKIGVNNHNYILTIEEGQAGFALATGENCPSWERYEGLGAQPVCLLDIEDLGPEGITSTEIPVKVEWIVDRGYNPDDVYCYVEVTPDDNKKGGDYSGGDI